MKTMLLTVLGGCLFSGDLEQSPRMTPTVKIAQKTHGAVVAIFSQPAPGRMNFGSGSIIHPGGFILTNDHVVRDSPGVVLREGMPPSPYRLVARLPEKDLAIVQIKPDKNTATIPLGKSHDLMIGEPVLAAGNPGGRGIVFTSGIVSSPAFLLDAPNALIMSQFRGDGRDRYIQFDAAVNGGNSGGPLINAEGMQIGVVARKNHDAENTNFAIPIDRVLQQFDRLVDPEVRFGVFSGLHVDAMRENAEIVAIDENSPAAQCGLQVADVLVEIDGRPVSHAVDWLLSLTFRAPGNTLPIRYRRGETTHDTVMTLAEFPTAVAEPEADRKPGLRYSLFHGDFSDFPDYKTLTAVKTDIAGDLNVARLAEDRKDNYSIVFEGYLRFPHDGLFRLILASDDGSRLFFRDQLLIDNGGNHPVIPLGSHVRVTKGLHPVRIEFFQGIGEAALKLAIEEPGKEPREVDPSSWLH